MMFKLSQFELVGSAVCFSLHSIGSIILVFRLNFIMLEVVEAVVMYHLI